MGRITNRRDFLRLSGAAAGASLLGATAGKAQAAAEGEPRNMVFILIDDMRFDAMSMMGHPFLETPHLDALAKESLFCEHAYVTTSLCSPSRASILTGQYAHTHGVMDNGTLIPKGTPTFPEELEKHGYDTGFFGKWHMGGSSDAPRPGFKRWVSFKGQGVYNNPTFNIDGEQEKKQGYVTDLITDYATEFIERKRETPFFAYVSHKAVHADFYPAKRHQGCYADQKLPHPASMANSEEHYAGKPEWVRRQRQSWHGVDGMYNKQTDFDGFVRDYAETMRAVDDSVGRIVASLKAAGIYESTLLLFTSDNGFLFGEHGLIDKRCMYEPSIRVPLIAHCPELFGAGARRQELLLNIDFAPTLLEAAGVPIPESVQGRSFLPVLSGESTAWRDAFLYEYFWERSFPQTPSVLGVRTERYKLMHYHGVWDRYELYDLEEDPDEMNNLLGPWIQENEAGPLDNFIMKNATPEIKKLFSMMKAHLERLIKESGATLVPDWKA